MQGAGHAVSLFIDVTAAAPPPGQAWFVRNRRDPAADESYSSCRVGGSNCAGLTRVQPIAPLDGAFAVPVRA